MLVYNKASLNGQVDEDRGAKERDLHYWRVAVSESPTTVHSDCCDVVQL